MLFCYVHTEQKIVFVIASSSKFKTMDSHRTEQNRNIYKQHSIQIVADLEKQRAVAADLEERKKKKRKRLCTWNRRQRGWARTGRGAGEW